MPADGDFYFVVSDGEVADFYYSVVLECDGGVAFCGFPHAFVEEYF